MHTDTISQKTSRVAVLQLLSEVFRLPVASLNDDVAYQTIVQWDSVAHIQLMAALETAFDVNIDQNQVLQLVSVAAIVSFIESQTAVGTPEPQKSQTVNAAKVDIKRGLNNVFLDETKITHIDGEAGRLLCRGYAVDDLVENASYEAMAYLLIYGRQPNATELADFSQQLDSQRTLPGVVITVIEALAPTQPPMDVLRTAISTLAVEIATLPVAEQMLAMLAKAPLILGYHQHFAAGASNALVIPTGVSQAALMTTLLLGDSVSIEWQRWFEKTMVVQAEHGLNASAFTARVCVGAEAGFGAVMSAAMAAFAGDLHGGALLRAMDMFEAIGSIDAVPDFVRTRMAEKLPMYGFGHRVYRTEDPRAYSLFQAAQHLSQETGEHYWLDMLTAIKQEMQPYMKHGLNINVDFYASVIYRLMGIDKAYFIAIFACNRIAGWAAHMLEQQQKNILIRPRLHYIGPKNQHWGEVA